MKSLAIEEINKILQGKLVGSTSNKIIGPEQIEKAEFNQITFVGDKSYSNKWVSSKACAAIINRGIDLEPGDNKAIIFVKDACLAMVKVLEMFKPELPQIDEDIHSTAIIHETVKIGAGCRIGANCYIGKNVELGDGVLLYPNVTIFDECKIGSQTTIWPGTVIRERCIIGSQCIFHSNVIIGADGFGYLPSEDGKGLVKIPQIGNVIIGNGVEIGANSCVDRAKFSSTIIGDGCKIDNLVQIAHNCILGKCCIMAGNSGLAGSVTLGNGVIIGGAASIKDHISLGDGAVVGACSGVTKDVKPGETVFGYPAREYKKMMKQWATISKLSK